MSTANRNRFRADLREFEFQLFEQGKLGELLGKEKFANWGPDEVRMVLNQTRQFTYDVVGPLNGSGDVQGCRIEDGRLKTPEGYADAWRQLYELGVKTVGFHAEFGGQDGPTMVQVAIEEMLSGANVAFNMYSGLAFGAAELVATVGTKEQKALYPEGMTNGKWGGTMCLTEPQAGSDVGAATTKAIRQPDGRFKIQGTKIYISGGDNDFTENVIHLVLARIDGAPAGTKGLSLFIVPRLAVNADGTSGAWNDVTLGGIEHKMGINGSATCVLNFGENDHCYGELVGGVENEGMRQMFVMMNAARLAVGIQGLAVGSAAYLSALAYAKERKQGPSMENFKDPSAPKVAIINHPDIRRSLLEMKSKIEGIRAMVVKLARHNDLADLTKGKDDDAYAYHKGQLDLLVPLVKAYGSDQAFRVAETAIQVHGGAGFIRDYGVEQDLRDSKIFSIYEGTNHIQAMDLVGRKLGQRSGANLQAFMADIAAIAERAKSIPSLAKEGAVVAAASEALMTGAMRFMGWAGEGQLKYVALNANRYLECMSEVTVGSLLLEGAEIAHAALEKGTTETDFYKGKIASAQYFIRNLVALVPAKIELMATDDDSSLEITDAGYAQA